jgi:magnesium transporter
VRPEDVEDILSRIRIALEGGRIDYAIQELARLHPVDQAEAFLDLDEPTQMELLTKLDPQARADIFEEMPEEDAAELAAELPPQELAEVLDEMHPESAADILSELTEEQAASALERMEEATEVKPLMGYREDTAGGLMSPEFIALEGAMGAQQVIELLRSGQAVEDIPYYLYVLGPGRELVGVVPLRELIAAPPDRPVSEIMRGDVISVPVDTDQEELAKISKRYRLLLLPVVDQLGRMVGVVKSSDLVDVIEEEATEDIFRLGGVSDGQIQVWSPVSKSIGRRLPWLMVNLLTAFLAAWVVNLFHDTLAKLAVLAVFQGIIAGQGGNAGTQTLTLIVRGLALGEIEFRDTFRALARELFIGLIHGVAVGAAVGLGAYLWMDMPFLGVIAAIAMVGTMLAAACAGTLIPLLLRACHLDPALASGVLVTTVTDCVGFGLFLYLASVYSASLQ